jgi:copper chaperone CopZ
VTHYVHHVPGRLRVRTPALKRNRREGEKVRTAVQAIEGVTAVDVNHLTGSVTVAYDKDSTGPRAILDLFHAHGYIADRAAAADLSHAEDAASRAGQAVAKFAVGMVVEKLVEHSAIALIGALI